jgi:hypothetical protein
MFVKNYIKGIDHFGHTPKFHFGSWKKRKDDCEEEYKTLFGGFISLVINIVYYVCVGYFAYMMFTHGKDSI